MRRILMAGLALSFLMLGSDARADSTCKVLVSDLQTTAASDWAWIQVGISTTQPGVDFQQDSVGLWGFGQMYRPTPLPLKVNPILTASSDTRQRSSSDAFTTTAKLRIDIYDVYGLTFLSSSFLGTQILSTTSCSGNTLRGFDSSGRLHVLTFTKMMRVY